MNDFWKTFLPRFGWIAVLTAFFVYFFRQWYQLYCMRYWKTAEGRVTHFSLSREGQNLWPDVEYCYRVSQKDYHSSYLFADTVHNSPQSRYARQLAHRVAIAYKSDAGITVYYNPQSPEQAVLDTRIPKKLTMILVVLGGLLVFEITITIARLVSWQK